MPAKRPIPIPVVSGLDVECECLNDVQDTAVDDADRPSGADKTLTKSDRGPSVVVGASVVSWRPGVTDWLTQRARRVGSTGTG